MADILSFGLMVFHFMNVLVTVFGLQILEIKNIFYINIPIQGCVPTYLSFPRLNAEISRNVYLNLLEILRPRWFSG